MQVVEKRKKMQENAMKRYEKNANANKLNAITEESDAIAGFSSEETMQRKEKEIKEKEIKKEKDFCFENFFEKFPKKTYEAEARNVWEEINAEHKAEIAKILPFWQ